MVVWQTKQRFCFHKVSQGSKPSLFMNLLQTWLANCCESYLVESPLLYLAFFKTILAASEFRNISLSPLFFFFVFKTFISRWPFQHPTFAFSQFFSSFFY